MATKHSFNSYINKVKNFESTIVSANSFYSYIRNQHIFGEYPTETQTEINSSLFVRFINGFTLTISNILMRLNLLSNISFPKMLMTINDNLISMEQRLEDNFNVDISAPSINATIESSQLVGDVEISIPQSMSVTISESISLADNIISPNIEMTVNMTSERRYLLNYYDSYLLSELDSNLLSEMDSVPA